MTDENSMEIRIWGLFGAFWAAAFAIWMLFLPERVPDFAWVVHPRLAEVFIGGGYIFRTAFFLAVAIWPAWGRMRWIFWGNLAFTGTLLLATFWHADEFRWGTIIGHAWLILYVAEPVSLIYLAIGRSLRSPVAATGGPLSIAFRRFLMLEAGTLALFGALLVINPEFARTRWPWDLNPLDARMAAAWFVGWSVWSGTMAFARDWDEIRMAAVLNVIAASSFLVVSLASYNEFSSPRSLGYIVSLAVMAVAMAFFIWRQEARRPSETAAAEPPDGEAAAGV